MSCPICGVYEEDGGGEFLMSRRAFAFRLSILPLHEMPTRCGSMRPTWRTDMDAYLGLCGALNKQAWVDLRGNNEFYLGRRMRREAAEVSSQLNDTYLKISSQADGVKRLYGRVVDLMLAYARNRQIPWQERTIGKTICRFPGFLSRKNTEDAVGFYCQIRI